MKDFKDYQSLLSCRDYQCHQPYTFQRLSMSSALYFSRLSKSSLLFQDYHNLLYISQTIRVFCLQDNQSLLAYRDYQCLLLFTFQRLQCLLSRLSQSSLHFKNFNVFCQDYHNLLYISKTSMSIVKTITIFFTFERLQCLLSRISQSTLLFQDYQSLLSCRDYQFLLLFTFQRLQCLLSRLSQSSLLF